MSTVITPVEGNANDTEYHELLADFAAAALRAVGAGPVFTTDAPDLFDRYLGNFPLETRQHFNCNSCRRFLQTYGGLVTIDVSGETHPIFWPADTAAGTYDAAIRALRREVKQARVTGVFYTKDKTWGQPVTGPWRHFAVTFPHLRFLRQRPVAGKTPGQLMAQVREDYGTVQRALADFPRALLEQAVALLSSDAAYRGERVLAPAQWLRDLSAAKHNTAIGRQANVVWKAVALAPEGFCHPRSSVIGTVLEDLKAGLTSPEVLARFAAKMAPGAYQRATVAPTATAIAQAEQLFDELELAPALGRRFAELRDVPESGVLWRQPRPVARGVDITDKLFAHIAPKGATPAANLTLPSTTLTWVKFQRDVLPTAYKVEAQVPASAARFAALVTALDPTAPPILQWDREEARNPASWYYAAGIDGEMRRRVESAGGQYTDVDVRATLLWDSYTDLDLHIEGPDGHIYYGCKRAGQGWLDVDANPGGGSPGYGTRTPVENIRWAKGYAPRGRYNVYVHHYATGRDPAHTPFAVELEIAGEVLRFEGETTRVGQQVPIAEFSFGVAGAALRSTTRAIAPATPNTWGVTPGAFVPVTAFVTSPNLWGAAPMPHHGRHVFAVLEGCADGQEGRGRGFFTESLRSELRPVRSVLEAYAKDAVIAPVAAPVAGLGFSDQAPWGLVLRVTTAGTTALYTIDRAE
jgi:hypothetical protein